MAELTNKLPPYQFLTAFSLLISRICHANQTVFNQLEVRFSVEAYYKIIMESNIFSFIPQLCTLAQSFRS